MAWTPPHPPTPPACPFCGAVLVAGAASCPRCGSSVGGVPPQFAAPAPPSSYPVGPPQPFLTAPAVPPSGSFEAVPRPVQDDRSLYDSYLEAYTSPSRRGIRATAVAVGLVAALGVAAIGYGLSRPDPRATGLGTPAISGSAFASEFPSSGAGAFPSGFPAPSATAGPPASSAPAAPTGVPYHSAAGHFTARFPNTPTPVNLTETVGGITIKVSAAVDPVSSTEVAEEQDQTTSTGDGDSQDLLQEFLDGFSTSAQCPLVSSTPTTFRGSAAVQGDCTAAANGSDYTVLVFLYQGNRVYVLLAASGSSFDALSTSFSVTS
jgi:hypothetical protein